MQENNFNVIYIGGPTAIFEVAGLRLMTDPALDPSGSKYQFGSFQIEKTKSPANVDIGLIDIVLLSHDQHIDNLDKAGRLFLEKVWITYTTVDGSDRLKGTSIGLSPWQSQTVMTPDGREMIIMATPARHGPAGIEKINGDVIGFLLTIKGEKRSEIYITGDTVYYEGVADVAKRFDPKYVFIFAGAAHAIGPFNVTMDNNDVIDTALAFPNATIIPLHYDGRSHYTQNEKDIKQSYETIGIDKKLRILEEGKAITFEM